MSLTVGLTVGLTVKILPYSEYRGRYEGKLGVIEQYCDDWDTVGIKIDGCYNVRSKNGNFWFSKDKIKVLESENYDMNSEKFLVAGIKFQIALFCENTRRFQSDPREIPFLEAV